MMMIIMLMMLLVTIKIFTCPADEGGIFQLHPVASLKFGFPSSPSSFRSYINLVASIWPEMREITDGHKTGHNVNLSLTKRNEKLFSSLYLSEIVSQLALVENIYSKLICVVSFLPHMIMFFGVTLVSECMCVG